MAFPTARRLAAALACMHNGAEALRGADSGAAAGGGPSAAYVEGDLGGHQSLSSGAAAAGRPPVPSAPQGAAAAPASMPLLVLPGASAEEDLAEVAQPSGPHAAHCALQPPPPVPALGGIVLQGGGVTVVRQGPAACGRSCAPAAAAAAPVPASPGAAHVQPPAHEPAPQRPLAGPCGSPAHAAAALAAKAEPARDGRADSAPETGSEAGARPLRCVWRVRLSECVDAAPVIIAQPRPQGLPGHETPADDPARVPEEGPGGWGCYALACSHGGDVVCVEASRGALVWRATLLGRADAGLAVTADMQAWLRRACLCTQCSLLQSHVLAL